jgi:hypothetical protein
MVNWWLLIKFWTLVLWKWKLFNSHNFISDNGILIILQIMRLVNGSIIMANYSRLNDKPWNVQRSSLIVMSHKGRNPSFYLGEKKNAETKRSEKRLFARRSLCGKTNPIPPFRYSYIRIFPFRYSIPLRHPPYFNILRFSASMFRLFPLCRLIRTTN